MPRTLHLLPEIIDPVENRYLVIAVPDDDAYLRAVMGQLGQLAKWNNWQRDPLHLGREAAERFHRAYLETLELLEELEYNVSPLTINVNCGSTCCPTLIQLDLDVLVHVGQDVIDDINALPGGQFDNGYLVPSPDYLDYAGYQTTKCAYANQLAVDVYNSWENLATLALTAGAMSIPAFASMLASGALASSLVGILGGVITTATLATAIVGALVAIGTVFGLGFYAYFEVLQNQMTVDGLRCALYGATDAEDARNRVAGQFYDWGVEAGLLPIVNGEFLTYLVQFVRLTTPVTILEPLFDLTAYVAALPVADCSLCPAVQPPPGPGTLADGLINYWEFEEDAGAMIDSHGAFDLPRVGTVALDLNGISGAAAYFNNNGANRLQAIDPHVGIFNGQGSWTQAIWANFVSVSSNYKILMGQVYDGNIVNSPYYVSLNYITGTIGFAASGGSGSFYTAVHPTIIQVEEWNLIVVWYDGDTNKLGIQVNNQEVIESNGPTAIDTESGQAYRVGAYGNGNLPMHGSLDELARWSRVLTADERTALWNVGFGLTYENIVNPGGPA